MMKDFLTFRKMFTPILIQIIFWVGVVACLVMGIRNIVIFDRLWMGIELLVVGPVVLRIVTEVILLGFRINDNLFTLTKQRP